MKRFFHAALAAVTACSSNIAVQKPVEHFAKFCEIKCVNLREGEAFDFSGIGLQVVKLNGNFAMLSMNFSVESDTAFNAGKWLFLVQDVKSEVYDDKKISFALGRLTLKKNGAAKGTIFDYGFGEASIDGFSNRELYHYGKVDLLTWGSKGALPLSFSQVENSISTIYIETKENPEFRGVMFEVGEVRDLKLADFAALYLIKGKASIFENQQFTYEDFHVRLGKITKFDNGASITVEVPITEGEVVTLKPGFLSNRENSTELQLVDIT